MDQLQAIVDRVELAALAAEFTDAGAVRDYDRFARLFTEDGVWRMPHNGIVFTGRSEIRAGVERLQGLWEYFVQTVHSGSIRLDGDFAAGRVHTAEFGRMRDGRSYRNHAIYHDRYRRTADGWRFAERVYEVRYLDTTPLAGSVPAAKEAISPEAGL